MSNQGEKDIEKWRNWQKEKDASYNYSFELDDIYKMKGGRLVLTKPYYKTCSFCDANLDPGERCDCMNKFLISNSFVIGVDISRKPQKIEYSSDEKYRLGVPSEDISVLQICMKDSVIETFYGTEAEAIYSKLTGHHSFKSERSKIK